MILFVPAAMTVLVFAVVAILVQALKNRSLFKSVFNAGRVVTSAGVAALVFVLLHGPDHTVGYAQVGAALVAAVCYLAFNTAAIASILATLGTPWREAVFGGLWGRLLVAGASRRRCDPDGLAGVRSRGVPAARDRALARVPLSGGGPIRRPGTTG